MGAIDEKPALEGRVERLVDLTRKTVPMTRMNRIAIVAAMTLCRAYGRTRDPALEAPAQATLDFIMAAQSAWDVPQLSWMGSSESAQSLRLS